MYKFYTLKSVKSVKSVLTHIKLLPYMVSTLTSCRCDSSGANVDK